MESRPKRATFVPIRDVYVSPKKRTFSRGERVKIPEGAVPKAILDHRVPTKPQVTGYRRDWLVEFVDSRFEPMWIPEEQFSEMHDVKKDTIIREYEEKLVKGNTNTN